MKSIVAEIWVQGSSKKMTVVCAELEQTVASVDKIISDAIAGQDDVIIFFGDFKVVGSKITMWRVFEKEGE